MSAKAIQRFHLVKISTNVDESERARNTHPESAPGRVEGGSNASVEVKLPDSPNRSIDRRLAETNQGRATTSDCSAPSSVAFAARH